MASGKVLAVSTRFDEPDSSSQLYDAASGRWAPTGPCEQCGYRGPSVTALPGGPRSVCGDNCGKVLLAGGKDKDGTGSDAAFLFDPNGNGGLGTWTPTAAMNFPRVFHTATLLAGGEVLVSGGCDQACDERGPDDPVASAETFDPRTSTWRPTGSMALPRYHHTATLLDPKTGNCGENCGKVLVASGSSGKLVNGRLSVYDSAELYDPTKRAWVATSSAGGPRWGHTATQLRTGKVLVVGGVAQPLPLNTAELYDPATGRWDPQPSLLRFGRRDHTSTLLPSGQVLVVGGDSRQNNPSIAELYDPAAGQWTPAGPAIHSWSLFTATLLSGPPASCGDNCGKVLLAGGNTNAAELYSPDERPASPEGKGGGPGVAAVGLVIAGAAVLVVMAGTVLRLRRRSGRAPSP